MRFQKNTVHSYIFRIFLWIAALFLILNIFFAVFLRIGTNADNQEEMYAIEKSMYNGFGDLNTVIRSAEKVIKENESFFKDYESSFRNEDLVHIVAQTKELMIYNTYIEDVVFYKVGYDRLITTKGTINKNEFFNYAYYNENNNMEFWDDIMLKYNTPTIVPLSDYTNPFGNVKRLFIVPKIYPLYDTGVLIFVNEQNFLNFSGLSSGDIHAKVRLYSDDGYLIMSNAEDAVNSLINPSELHNNSKVTKIGLFGNYYLQKWFEYENIIFTFEKFNSNILIFELYFILFLTVLFLFACHFIRNTKKTKNLISGSDARMRYPILLACATTKDFYLKHKEMVDGILMVGEKEKFCLAAFVYNDEKELFSEIEKKFERKGCLVYAQDTLCLLLLKYETIKEKEQITKILDELQASYSQVRQFHSRDFHALTQLNPEFQKLKMEIGKHSVVDTIGTVRYLQLPNNMRAQFSKLISEQSRGKIKEYISSVIEENISNGVSYDNLLYLVLSIYYLVIEVTAADFQNKTVIQADQMFYEGIKRFYCNYDMKRIQNILFNAVNILLDQSAKKETKLDRKEIIHYLEESFRENIYMENVAERYQMTGKNFSYYFKKEFGIGFSEYLTQLRLEEGKRMLHKKELSIAAISEKIGYSNPATFIMAFKKYCGETPGQFRKKDI